MVAVTACTFQPLDRSKRGLIADLTVEGLDQHAYHLAYAGAWSLFAEEKVSSAYELEIGRDTELSRQIRQI